MLMLSLLAGCQSDGPFMTAGSQGATTPTAQGPAAQGPAAQDHAAGPAAEPASGTDGPPQAIAVSAPAPSSPAGTPTVIAGPPGGYAAARSSPVKVQMAGPWTLSEMNGARGCKLTLGGTGATGPQPAEADIACSSEAFMIRSWDLAGDELILRNHMDAVVARLTPAGPNRFEGRTGNGGSIAVSR